MNKTTSAKNAARVAELTEKQVDLLTRIGIAASEVDAHIERKQVKPFSNDVFNALKKKEMVGAHGKFIWVTKQGAFVFAAVDEAAKTVVPDIELVEEQPITVKKAKRQPKTDGPTLDWAFRRLRRQAVLFFGADDAEKRKQLREETDAITGGYATLASHFGGSHSVRWMEFMENFFAHEIHPGSRK